MSYCGNCEKDTHPVKDLGGDGRVKDLCGVCGSFLQPEPVTIVSVNPDGKSSTVVGQMEVVRPPDYGDGMPRINVQVAPAPAPTLVTTETSGIPLSRPDLARSPVVIAGHGDIIGQAKARLAVIDTELLRLAAMQREHRKLTAMVAAAEAADADDPDPAAAAQAAE